MHVDIDQRSSIRLQQYMIPKQSSYHIREDLQSLFEQAVYFFKASLCTWDLRLNTRNTRDLTSKQ